MILILLAYAGQVSDDSDTEGFQDGPRAYAAALENSDGSQGSSTYDNQFRSEKRSIGIARVVELDTDRSIHVDKHATDFSVRHDAKVGPRPPMAPFEQVGFRCGRSLAIEADPFGLKRALSERHRRNERCDSHPLAVW